MEVHKPLFTLYHVFFMNVDFSYLLILAGLWPQNSEETIQVKLHKRTHILSTAFGASRFHLCLCRHCSLTEDFLLVTPMPTQLSFCWVSSALCQLRTENLFHIVIFVSYSYINSKLIFWWMFLWTFLDDLFLYPSFTVLSGNNYTNCKILLLFLLAKYSSVTIQDLDFHITQNMDFKISSLLAYYFGHLKKEGSSAM